MSINHDLLLRALFSPSLLASQLFGSPLRDPLELSSSANLLLVVEWQNPFYA